MADLASEGDWLLRRVLSARRLMALSIAQGFSSSTRSSSDEAEKHNFVNARSSGGSRDIDVKNVGLCLGGALSQLRAFSPLQKKPNFACRPSGSSIFARPNAAGIPSLDRLQHHVTLHGSVLDVTSPLSHRHRAIGGTNSDCNNPATI